MTGYMSIRRIMAMLTFVGIAIFSVAQTVETGKLSAYVRHALKESQREQHITRGGDASIASGYILAFVKVHGGTELLKKHGSFQE